MDVLKHLWEDQWRLTTQTGAVYNMVQCKVVDDKEETRETHDCHKPNALLEDSK